MSDSRTSRNGADTDSYELRSVRKRRIDTSKGVRALMADSLISETPAPPDEHAPAAKPVITEEVIQENYRRVGASAKNTLIRVHPDGKREYHEDRVVRETDGVQDTLRTDRGKGTTESIKMLRDEGAVTVDKLLPGRTRDSSGRFKKGGK